MSAYRILELCGDATLDDVRRAYRRLALKHHPDRPGGDAAKFREVQAAVEEILEGGARQEGPTMRRPTPRADNVRVLAAAPWGLLTVDEKRIYFDEDVALEVTDEESLLCACVLADGRVSAGSSTGRVHLVDPRVSDGSTCIPLEHAHAIMAVCEAQENVLLMATAGEKLLLLDLASEIVLRSLPAFAELQVEAIVRLPLPATDTPSAPRVSLLMACGLDDGAGRLQRVDASDDQFAPDAFASRWHAPHEQPVYAVACSPARPELVAAASAADVTLHDSKTGDVLARLAAGGGVLYALAFSPSGACLLAAGSEALIHAFHCPAGTKRAVARVDDGERRRACSLTTSCINAVAFDGEHAFVAGGYDAAVTRWELARPPSPPRVRDCASCPSATTCEKGRAALAPAAAAAVEPQQPQHKGRLSPPDAGAAAEGEASPARVADLDLSW